MKKIINGKKYDTTTATEISSCWGGESTSDFNYYEESLYRKKTGEYFLHGKGGPMTKYARSCGCNSWCGGSGIIPLSLEEAKDWVESHANSSFEEIFGTVEE